LNAIKSVLPRDSLESIRKIDPGAINGEMVVTPMKVPGASARAIRDAGQVMKFVGQVPAGGGAPTSWMSKSTLGIKQPMIISGLTPATTYVFQARALTKTGFTDWSDSVTRVAV